MVGPAGFEPAANGLKGRCSTAELRALAGGPGAANPRARGARERAVPGWAGGSVCPWKGVQSTEERVPAMGGGCAGAPAEEGKEGDEGHGGSKVEEPDAASRRLPPQPFGLTVKGSHAASAGLNGVPAPPCAHFLAWKPFAVNAAPIDGWDALLAAARGRCRDRRSPRRDRVRC